MPDTVVINIITPPQEPVDIDVTVHGSTDVEVSSIGETGPIGPAGPGIEPIYSKTFGSVTNDTILPVEHGLSVVRGVTVLAPNRSEVEVYVEQRTDNSVFIDSNINLLNYILKIY